ncbi:MAG TPA: hypothetical protein VMS00_13230 [Acidimicrobiales bacterium]|nr:hypothetical protein [Acidimicrobiales bacterium]
MKIAWTVLFLSGAVSFAAGAGATTAPVPAHFEPGSVSFVSASQGFVLGTSPCTSEPCTALVTTANGSKAWAATTAPPAPFASASSPSSGSVSQVLFANDSDGWVYGPTLLATYNGAESWTSVKLGGPVYLLATSAHEVYAVVGSCSPSARNCPTPTLRLERAAVGSGVWHAVPGVSGYGTSAVLRANGVNAWVSFPPKKTGAVMIWRSSNSGSTWQRLPNPCYQPSQATDLAGMASPGGDLLFELCAGNPGAGQEGKSLWASTNGGISGHVVSKLPLGGLALGLAAPSSSDILVTAVSGATFVYRSTNGGATWTTHSFADGGAGLYNLAFATPSFGNAVEGSPVDGPNDDRLLETSDGGATWSPVHI